MRRLTPLLSLIVLASLLFGCGPIYQREFAYVAPPTSMGKMCTAQCIQGKNACQQMCQMRNDNCRAQARQDAYFQYEEYKRERHREGKEVEKSVSNFDYGSFNCNQSCNCTPTYNACYSACGGQVLEREVCVAFCGK